MKGRVGKEGVREGYIKAFQSSDLDHGSEILMRGVYAKAETRWRAPGNMIKPKGVSLCDVV